MARAERAYDFACDLALERLRDAFDAAGPWLWRLRDSSLLSDYLACIPADDARIRVFEYPGPLRVFVGLGDKGYLAMIQVESGEEQTLAELDAAFCNLIGTVGATRVTPIAPFPVP